MKIKSGIKVSESGFLFDPSTGESYSLNNMGTIYFNMIAAGKTRNEIKDFILGEYDVDDTTFEKSFIDFVSRLKFLRLIEHEK